MSRYDNSTPARPSMTGTPVPSGDGSVSAFRPSVDTSALRALQTIVEPGTQIDDFQVGRLLGRGSVAAVYDGTQTSTGRDIALKILDARFSSDQELIARFLAEGEALAQFDHPNIVKHIAHGQDETFVYIAMEMVHGITVDQLIHAIHIEPRHILRLAHEISKGLTTIHAAGMVHGDIKPSNILVTRPGEVKITDFGTAALSNVARAGVTKVSGTAAYIAPERLNRELAVDYRADIYSLGATFYKILTGKVPSDPWTPASSLNPELPAGVDAVLEKALQTDPDARFITAKEFCDALAAFFEDQPGNTTGEPQRAAAAVESVPTAPYGQHAEPEPAMEPPKKPRQDHGIDWKMVVLCALAAIGVAATLIVLAVFFGKW